MEQETKKTILIVLWCVAAAVLVAGAVWLWMYFAPFSSYHSKQYRFSMIYPNQWKMMDGNPQAGLAIVFVRPKETALDVLQPNVNITLQDVPDKFATIESFSTLITKQMTNYFKTTIKVIQDKDYTFARRKGHCLVIAVPKPEDYRMIFVWTIKGSYAYIFTFMCKGNQYEKLLPTVKRMINSFEFK